MEVGDQIEQLVLIERINHARGHERHGVRLAALDLIERHGGELLRITGIGRHHELAVFDVRATHQRGPVRQLNLFRSVLVGNDLGGFNDVLEQVPQGVAGGDTRQIRAHATASPVKTVTGRAADRVVHGLAVLKAATLDSTRSQRQPLLDGVSLARSLRRGIGRITPTGPTGGEFLVRLALRGIGDGRQGVLANVLDEATETVAALPRGCAREPAEEGLPERRSPTHLGFAQEVGVSNLLLVRTADGRLRERGGITAVAIQEGVAGVAQVGIVGSEHERHALGHDRR